ncbi:MAG: zinc ribbon domain-containing protein [Roseiflexaceae bacterium]|nr:zinc ribbon domain-containing protein [Roseiflexaceae bacterium]
MFRSMLTYKADRNDTHLILIGRFFPSSKTCGACGRVNRDLTRSDRIWTCRDTKRLWRRGQTNPPIGAC